MTTTASCQPSAFAGPILLDRLARLALAAVWAYQGLWHKLLTLGGSHEKLVAAATGLSSTPATVLTAGIGLVEVALAGWVLTGRGRSACAATQTGLLIAMNAVDLALAGDRIHDPIGMVLSNAVLLMLAWFLVIHPSREAAP